MNKMQQCILYTLYIQSLTNIFGHFNNHFRLKIDFEIKKQFVKIYISSVALYGSKTWTIEIQEKKRIECFEILYYTGILHITWTDNIRNEEVLISIGER